MKISRSLAAFILLLSTATPSIALAEGGHLFSVFAPKEAPAQVNDDCPKHMNDVKFMRLLADYSSVFHDASQNLRQWDLEDQATNAVFCAVGTSEYVSYLKDLERAAPRDPDAYYNLARRLQSHWQSQYALGLSKLQHQRMEKAAELSRDLSIVAMALGKFAPTAQVPTIFSLIRQLFPVFAPEIAVGSEQLLSKHGMFNAHIPLSPAHIMTGLPLPAENSRYNSYEIWRNLIAASLSVAGAQAAIQAVKYFELAMDVGKGSFNLPVIIASIVVGQLVQDTVTYEIDEHHYRSLLKDMLCSRDELLQAIQDKNYMKMRTYAENFKNAAIQLSAFLDSPAVKIWAEYDNAVQSAKSNPKWKQYVDTALDFLAYPKPEYFFPDDDYRKKEIQDAAKKRDNLLEAIESAQEPRSLQDVERAITMNLLQNGPEMLNSMTGEQKVQAQLVLGAYPSYLETQSPALKDSPNTFKTYISQIEQDKSSLLAQELMRDEVKRNPAYILLEAAAFLDSLNQSALDSTVDDLYTVIYSGEMLK